MSQPPSARNCFRALLVALGMLLLIRDWRAESSPPARAEDALDRHLAELGVKFWHNQNIRGAGIKIAILDSGFRGYRDFLGKTLPEQVAFKSFRRDGNLQGRDSSHGVLCAEVIHSIAPKAEMLFANWEPDDADSFVDAARWCRQQGANIVSCSVVIPAWSDGEGGGTVHQALNRIFGAGKASGDVLAIASAGNLAQRHWGGHYSDDGHGRHIWCENTTNNLLKPWGTERVSVELLAGRRTNCRVEVLDSATGQEVGAVQTHNGSDRFTQTVRFMPQTGHLYSLHIAQKETTSESFHVVALGAWLQHSNPGGSIMFPGDGPEWLTVGGIQPDGRRAPYSSCGPNSPRGKPDLMAMVPFPLPSRDRPFNGTSAASPQAAGSAALIWSRVRERTAAEVRDALCHSAVDIGPPGHDFESGFGRLALPSLRHADPR
jgi:subtilisin family serine protease